MSRSKPAHAALDLAIHWGDKLLALEHLCPPRRYLIGDDPSQEIAVDFSAVLPPELGATHALIDVSDGEIRVCPPGGAPLTLRERALCEVKIGELLFRVSVSSASVPRALTNATAIDRGALGSLGASISVHAVFFLCMALMPPKASSLSIDREQADDLAARYLLAPKDPLLDDSTSSKFEQQDPKAGSSPSGAGSSGQAGSPTSERAKRRSNRTTQSPEAIVETAKEVGILGVLSGLRETSSPYVSDASVADIAHSGLFGSEIGSSFGFGGLTMRGTGRGGGGDVDGAIGVGSLDTKGGTMGLPSGTLGSLGRKSRVPVAAHSTGAKIQGSLSKEVIRREIQRHMNEVRFCYEQALQHTPDLSGRITVRFVIAQTGLVMAASVESSSLENARVSDCVTQAVRRWSFPAPEDRGYVTVSYPFLFQSAL